MKAYLAGTKDFHECVDFVIATNLKEAKRVAWKESWWINESDYIFMRVWRHPAGDVIAAEWVAAGKPPGLCWDDDEWRRAGLNPDGHMEAGTLPEGAES